MPSLQSIEPTVFRVDPKPTLLGGYSPSSGHFHFPRQPLCPYTGAQDVEDIELSCAATLWGWTAVTAPPPGYDGIVPYGFGVVELTKERLRVVTRITEADPSRLNFGDSMTLVADVVGRDKDGNELAVWSFAPVNSAPVNSAPVMSTIIDATKVALNGDEKPPPTETTPA